MSTIVISDDSCESVVLEMTQMPAKKEETKPKTSCEEMEKVADEKEWIEKLCLAELPELSGDEEKGELLEERLFLEMLSQLDVSSHVKDVEMEDVDESEGSLQVVEAGRIQPGADDEGSVPCALNSTEASLSSTVQPLQVEVPILIRLADSKVTQGVVGLLKTKADIPPVSRTLKDMKLSNLEPLKHTDGPAAYLGDPLVNFWFETRMEQGKEYAALDSNLFNERQWPNAQKQLVELFEKGVSLVFFPISHNFHWTLLLLEKTSCRHYNSLSTKIPPPVIRFCEQLATMEHPVAGLPTPCMSLPRQTDLVSCGILVCLMAKHTIRSSLDHWTQEIANREVAQWRGNMLAELSEHEELLKRNEKPVVMEDDDSDIEVLEVVVETKKGNGEFEKALADVSLLLRDGSISQNPSVSPNTVHPPKPSVTAPKMLNGSTKLVILNLEVVDKKPDNSARIIECVETLGFTDLKPGQIQPVQSHSPMCAGYDPHTHFSSFRTASSAFHAWLQDQKPVKIDTKWKMVVPSTGPKHYPFWVFYFLLDIEVHSSGISIFNRTMWQGENAVEKIVGDVIKSVTKEQAKNALQKLTNKAQRIIKTAATHKDIEWSYWN